MAQVIDGHTHAFPPDIVENREAYCRRDDWFRLLYGDPRAKLTGAAELLESMDCVGVDRSIIAGFPWADAGLCREHNAWMAEVCREHPRRLAFLAIAPPTATGAAHDLGDAFRQGAVGAGELNADAQRFSLEDPADTAEIVEVCAEFAKPIMFHASEPVGHLYPGKGTATPEKLAAWLAAYPEQPVVLAHWGGGLPFYELNKAVRELTANVVYDCAATTYLYDFAVFRSVIDVVGLKRVIFGSDFPVLGQERLLRRVRAAVDAEHQDDLLHGNAERVFKLTKMEAA